MKLIKGKLYETCIFKNRIIMRFLGIKNSIWYEFIDSKGERVLIYKAHATDEYLKPYISMTEFCKKLKEERENGN